MDSQAKLWPVSEMTDNGLQDRQLFINYEQAAAFATKAHESGKWNSVKILRTLDHDKYMVVCE
jgi:hypothetical protein